MIVRNVDEITPGASAEIFKNGIDGFGYVMKARDRPPPFSRVSDRREKLALVLLESSFSSDLFS